MQRLQLIETGTRAYLQETLMKLHQAKTNYYNTLFNLAAVALFFILLGTALYFHRKPTLTPAQKQQQEFDRIAYIAERVKQYNLHQRRNVPPPTNSPLWNIEDHLPLYY